jgi:hypothetical protein
MNMNASSRLFVVALALPLFAACFGDDDASVAGGGGVGGGGGFLIQVIKQGTGQGTVTSAPAGITCGLDCAQNYARGTQLTLTATADPGNTFAGWSGVSGAGTACGSNVCTFTVNANLSAIAAFTANTSPGTLGEVVALNANNELLSFNRNTPNNIQTRAPVVLNATNGETLVGIEYKPGDILTGTGEPKVYGLVQGTTTSRVIGINAKTGAIVSTVTLAQDGTDLTVPYTNLLGTNFGMDFDPVNGRLRIVSDSATVNNLSVNIATGSTITDTNLNGAATTATAAAYSSNFANAPGTVLMLISGSQLLIQNPASSGTTTLAANLDITIGSVAGFDITGDSNLNTLAFLAATDTGAGATRFYTLNLNNGVTSSFGAIAAGNELIRGFAMAPAPAQSSAGNTFVLSSDDRLLSFNRATPATLRSGVKILGLAAGDAVIGMDFQPRDGVLYVVGKNGAAGRLYTVNTASGLATLVAAISGVSLTATDYGVSFRPTDGQLRLVGNNSQNVEIDPATGTATVHTSLSRDGAAPFPAPRNGAGATASAFTNSLAGVGSTTHFVIDTASDQLAEVFEEDQLPDTANDPQGELTNIGALGVDAASLSGFDIDPMETGGAYAALKVGAGTQLYKINLDTGAANGTGTSGAVLNIGTGATDVKSLAVAPPTGPLVYGVVTNAGQKLIRFSPADPTAVTVIGTILDGASAIPTIVGMDFQRVNGAPDRLYVVTKGANATEHRIYLVDTTTAAATAGTQMVASPDDPTSPFPGLGGANFGVDFNPTLSASVASLRITSDTEENLRVNVQSGETFTDTALTLGGAPGSGGQINVSGIAYGNNVPGTASTTLFGIDIQPGDGGGRIVTISGPGGSGGNVTRIADSTPIVDPTEGAIVANSKVGFDIVGSGDVLPLASLRLDDGNNYLYRVVLDPLFPVDTSAQIGEIGDGSLELQGFAILLEPPGL